MSQITSQKNTAPLKQRVEKYLGAYAEPSVREAAIPAGLLAGDSLIRNIIVIPVYDEAADILLARMHAFSSPSVLQIWVFNCPVKGDSDAALRTRKVLQKCRKNFGGTGADQQISLLRGVRDAPLFFIDFCSEGAELPVKQGVGLARKLGLDLALKVCLAQLELFDRCVDWIHNSDADVTFPEGYFEIPSPEAGQVAAIYPFEHLAQSGYECSTALYDWRLRYYVERLEKAGSRYAFHTVGSLIAVTPLAYTQVRGMPKRSGGEDFYLLNKLAKLGQVLSLSSPVLELSGRPSQRVPFGTGPALSNIQAKQNPVIDYGFYHPDIFCALERVLSVVRSMTAVTGDSFEQQLLDPLGPEIRERVRKVFQDLGLDRFLAHLRKQSQQDTWELFCTWFDAFRTLKFVHGMRHLGYHDVNLQTVMALASNLSPDLIARCERLMALTFQDRSGD